MEKAPSVGKTAMIGVGGGTAGVVCLLFVARHVAWLNDMTPAEAAAIIAQAGILVGWAMHVFQRHQESKTEKEKPNV